MELPDDAKVCSRCGISFTGASQSAAVQQPAAPAQPTVTIDESGQIFHECGYPLLPGTQVCPNCHKPVVMPAQSAAPVSADPKMTQRMPVSSDPKVTQRMPVGQTSASQPDKQTRRDMEVPYTPAVANEKRTMKDVLPNRSAEVQGQPSAAPTPSTDKKTVVISRNPQQSQTPVDKKTIVGFSRPQAEPEKPQPETFYCSLKPMTRSNEPEERLVKKEYETAMVVLNRDNTEPENYSITSREQAVLTCENGVWFIEDRSALRTTFVHVARKMPLQDGDVVLLGDREFVFTTKKEE
jgi:hypothetical protein